MAELDKKRLAQLVTCAILGAWRKETGSCLPASIEGTICISASFHPSLILQLNHRPVSSPASSPCRKRRMFEDRTYVSPHPMDEDRRGVVEGRQQQQQQRRLDANNNNRSTSGSSSEDSNLCIDEEDEEEEPTQQRNVKSSQNDGQEGDGHDSGVADLTSRHDASDVRLSPLQFKSELRLSSPSQYTGQVRAAIEAATPTKITHWSPVSPLRYLPFHSTPLLASRVVSSHLPGIAASELLRLGAMRMPMPPREFMKPPLALPFAGKEEDKETSSNHEAEINPDQKVYKCNFCQKTFLFKSKYHEHLPVHTSARPFQCHLCTRTYKYKYDLRVHLRTHLGIPTKSTICPFCSTKFATNKLLRAHIKQAHNEQQKISDDQCKRSLYGLQLLEEQQQQQQQQQQRQQPFSSLDRDKSVSPKRNSFYTHPPSSGHKLVANNARHNDAVVADSPNSTSAIIHNRVVAATAFEFIKSLGDVDNEVSSESKENRPLFEEKGAPRVEEERGAAVASSLLPI